MQISSYPPELMAVYKGRLPALSPTIAPRLPSCVPPRSLRRERWTFTETSVPDYARTSSLRSGPSWPPPDQDRAILPRRSLGWPQPTTPLGDLHPYLNQARCRQLLRDRGQSPDRILYAAGRQQPSLEMGQGREGQPRRRMGRARLSRGSGKPLLARSDPTRKAGLELSNVGRRGTARIEPAAHVRGADGMRAMVPADVDRRKGLGGWR